MSDDSKPQEFVPRVGAVYTAAQMQAIGPERLVSRELNDPAYSDAAVGSTEFDWRPHFLIRIADPALRNEVERSLDSFASTPEGRHTLRQAAAMQQVRLADGEFQLAQRDIRKGWDNDLRGDAQGRIIIAQETVGYGVAYFNHPQGVLVIQPHELVNATYQGEDGKTYPMPLSSLLYHELGHAKDPLIRARNRPALEAADELTRPWTNTIVNVAAELPAVRHGNDYSLENQLISQAMTYPGIITPIPKLNATNPVHVNTSYEGIVPVTVKAQKERVIE